MRRARIVLAIAAGEHQSSVAARLECDVSTVWWTCHRYRRGGLATLFTDERRGNSGHQQEVSPVQRAQIVELACLEPIAKGLHITHWSSEDLARQAVADLIVPAISPATVRRILHDVDLQPHRTRYWKTARLDNRFKERAEQVLWCYGNAARLAELGIWVVCVDGIPTFQVLERDPIRRAIPGSIEQQEFDDTRHGTVNMLVFLAVYRGLMELAFLASNDAAHYLTELELFRRHHQELRGVFLIQDGGSSHTAGRTRSNFADCDSWWRPRFTPANASWLNQAEILIHSFKHYYLEEGIMEEPGGVPEPCPGLLAGIQPPRRPSHRMDMDEPEDASVVRQTRREFIASFVSGNTSRVIALGMDEEGRMLTGLEWERG